MTAAIRHEIQAKHRLFREYKRSRLPAAWLAFKQQRNKVNSQIPRAKTDFVLALAPEEQTENCETGLSDNCQKLNLPRFHQLLAVVKKGKSPFNPSLVNASGNPMESDAENAELLNSFLSERHHRRHLMESYLTSSQLLSPTAKPGQNLSSACRMSREPCMALTPGKMKTKNEVRVHTRFARTCNSFRVSGVIVRMP